MIVHQTTGRQFILMLCRGATAIKTRAVAEQTFESNSPEQTESIAATLATTLRGGEVIALHGELGAGKTRFVRGLLRGLGGSERSVSSPTFVLLNVYSGGRLTVYHLDAYRVAGPDDFEAIGFTELLEQAGVVVVEWAERVERLLPRDRIDIMIEHIGEERRRFTLAGLGGSA